MGQERGYLRLIHTETLLNEQLAHWVLESVLLLARQQQSGSGMSPLFISRQSKVFHIHLEALIMAVRNIVKPWLR